VDQHCPTGDHLGISLIVGRDIDAMRKRIATYRLGG
jgi:hypothetical protein